MQNLSALPEKAVLKRLLACPRGSVPAPRPPRTHTCAPQMHGGEQPRGAGGQENALPRRFSLAEQRPFARLQLEPGHGAMGCRTHPTTTTPGGIAQIHSHVAALKQPSAEAAQH